MDLTRRTLIGSGAALGGAALLAACGGAREGGESQASSTPRHGGRLRLGILDGERSGNLDAHKPVGIGSIIRGFAMYAKPWEWSSRMTPDLALAELSEVAPDASYWTIRLRKGLEFHNGKTITADDLAFSILRLTDPALASPYGALVHPVDRSRVDKLDDRTVRIHFREGRGFVALPDTWTNFGGVVPTDYHPVTNPIGAGPYKIKEFLPGQRALFTRFENYFKAGKPYAGELEIIEFKDPTTRIAALLAGQIDMANALLPEQAGLLGQSARLLVSKTNTWQSFDMNMRHPLFQDPRVRQAFRLIADREDLVRRALQGQGRIGNDLYSPQDPSFDHGIRQRVTDIDQARSLLRQAGQFNPSVELVASPAGATSALVFAEQAKKAGVDIRVKKVDLATFNSPEWKDWAISTGGTLGLSWLPTGLHIDAPTAVANHTFFKDARFDRLFTAALAEPDLSKRTELVHAAQRIQHESGGLLIWGFTNILDGISPRVGGIEAEESHFPTWRFDKLWV
ncbi:hypothetical protein L288_20250 [Sphingobium quisquiliarum P25]|uniref:Solute-binding protein family 5 domain-containing protein n=1 Tax=Sphingobium quisquiliarum P25 TaxID=1329909 RepID=T0GF43_9SPHN|nr:ABC transporter substrate-binding protein [Sphingobium quisquiliarum]EQA98682.1 hypothetical protein L288_20250 [Sphingobium quisquiliarum P25]